MKFQYLRDKEKIFKLLEWGKIVHMQTIRMKQDLLTLKLEARNNGSIVAVFIVKIIFNYTSRINEGYFQACKKSKPITLALIFLKSSPGLLFFFFFQTSLLEYNCFTMVCQLLLYNKATQLYIYTYPHISSLLRLPPSHPPYPTPLGGHKAPS